MDALVVFLNVDMLHFAAAETHAEALVNLAELWEAIHETKRADRARALLEQ